MWTQKLEKQGGARANASSKLAVPGSQSLAPRVARPSICHGYGVGESLFPLCWDELCVLRPSRDSQRFVRRGDHWTG